jgi:hypothetical protein
LRGECRDQKTGTCEGDERSIRTVWWPHDGHYRSPLRGLRLLSDIGLNDGGR